MAAADDAVHSDFDDHPPTRFFDVGRTGPGALTEAARTFRAAIPDFHDTPELVLVEGDRAAYLGHDLRQADGRDVRLPADRTAGCASGASTSSRSTATS